jgi:hypothetical protein
MPTAHDADDRRKKPRLTRRLPVRFGTEARMCGGMVVDISEGGLRIESTESFPTNSVLNVFVQFPSHAVRLRARVIWGGGAERGSPAMGLAFTQPEPALAKAYKEWLAELKLMMQTEREQAHPPAAPAGGPAAGAAPGATAASSGAAAAPAAAPSAPPPPEPKSPVRRRLESRNGESFDVLMERRRGGWHLVVMRLPRQLGVDAPDLEDDFPDYAAAEKAVRDLVRAH